MLIDETYRLVMPPGEEIIHVLPQEYIVDNEQGIRDPIGMSGIRLEANFHIISGQVTAARNINKCVHRAGLNVTELILEPLASADAVLSHEEKEAGVVLVDIGGGTTDIAIFFDNIIRHTAVIPFGGNVVTEDIRQGCGIMRDQAELLKTKFGSALAAENKENEVVCIPGLRGREPKEISLRTLAGDHPKPYGRDPRARLLRDQEQRHREAIDRRYRPDRWWFAVETPEAVGGVHDRHEHTYRLPE